MAASSGKPLTQLLKAAMSVKRGAFPGWRSSFNSGRELDCPKSTDPGKSATQGVHVIETRFIKNSATWPAGNYLITSHGQSCQAQILLAVYGPTAKF